ncbi:DNA processing protein [Thermomonospora echinospora]|uniref:DNA processing protein n=1 Tax=Thermomonospora echinospora TaxID=1992 RepID=A0A1H6DNZ0_9ACTN|nr:DNA-processing protein DprA [Thermomonospora echinospora]SEG87009.1 DNA processing protein [Thermomonospora echinospora]
MTASDEERFARAALCAVAEPGEALLGRLIARVGPCGALAVVRGEEPPPDGVVIGDGGHRRLTAWRARLRAADTDADLAVCERLGGRIVCPGDPEWPVTLDDLGDRRPYALWLRGPADLRYACLRSVAIVGARAASPYGLRIAAELGAELADAGWSVVSGGALGIDAAAHRGALAADGQTVAVFANGVDRFYPPRNEALFVEMLHQGLLVSESPPGTDPSRPRFLVRNRVIAALTKGTVVVEAAVRSGALNTAAHARDLGRVLMAVPGPVGSRSSAGCHRLLREVPPARCVTAVAEILEEVGRIGTDLAPVPRGPVLPRDMLDPVTRAVLEALPARGAAGPAQIAVKAGVDLTTASGRLGQLSAAGFIERTTGGWRLRRRPAQPDPTP